MGAGFALGAWAGTAAEFAVAVAVWTVGEILVLPVSSAVVADLAPAAARGRYQGAYGMSFALAAALAPLAGTAVLQGAGAATLWLGCLAVGTAVAAGHLALGRAMRRAAG
jgi:MFS family permease